MKPTTRLSSDHMIMEIQDGHHIYTTKISVMTYIYNFLFPLYSTHDVMIWCKIVGFWVKQSHDIINKLSKGVRHYN